MKPLDLAADNSHGGSLAARIILALVLVFTLSLLGAAFLNFTKFQQTYMGLAQERYDTVLRDLRSDLENSLGIGLSLAATQSTQVVADRLVDQYDRQFSISIISPGGEQLFRAGSDQHGGDVDTSEFGQIATALILQDVFRGGSGDHLVNATQVLNPFRELEGYIVIEYDASRVRGTIELLATLLWRGVLAVGAIFMVIIAITIYFLIRPIERGFRRDQRAFDSLIKGETGSGALPEHPEETGYQYASEVDTEIADIERKLASGAKA